MKINRLIAMTAALVSWATLPVLAADDATTPAAPVVTVKPKVNPITASAGDPNWREEFAYAMGVQAYLYSFPWYYNQLLRWKWTTQKPTDPKVPYMALSQMYHARELVDASHTDGGMPNNDTLYSLSWVDLSKEPVILSVPDTGSRYYSIALMGFDGDNYDYVSKLQTGTKAGHYALIGPDWKGTLPKGIKATKRATTSTIFLIARTLIDGEPDKPAVHAIQDKYMLTPLSAFGKANAQIPEDRNVWPPYPRKDDPLADWRTLNRAMTEVPPTRDLKLVRQFALIGIGPGQDIDKVDDATRRGLVRALKAGRDILTSAAQDRVVAGQTYLNGWVFGPDNWGFIGEDHDYLARAIQSLRGINASNRVEGMYITNSLDAKGERYDGTRRYTLHFAPGKLPPVDAFWSLTAYNFNYNLMANPINRFSIGDRKRDLKYDADGGLTLYIQNESPGADKESNWLPVGPVPFLMALRAYLPRETMLKKTWMPPLLTEVPAVKAE